MDSQMGYIAICSGLSLLGFCYMLFWRYRSFRVDAFRQEIFALRDELFDDAVEGIIPFNHPAYGVLRRTMNGFIRFGHRLTLWHIVIIALMVNDNDMSKDEGFSEVLNRASANSKAETKQRIDSYKERMHKAAFQHLLLISPELLMIIVSYIIMRLCWSIAVAYISKKKPVTPTRIHVLEEFAQIERIDDAAMYYGLA